MSNTDISGKIETITELMSNGSQNVDTIIEYFKNLIESNSYLGKRFPEYKSWITTKKGAILFEDQYAALNREFKETCQNFISSIEDTLKINCFETQNESDLTQKMKELTTLSSLRGALKKINQNFRKILCELNLIKTNNIETINEYDEIWGFIKS